MYTKIDPFRKNYKYIRFIGTYKEFLASNWRIHRNIQNTYKIDKHIQNILKS